VTSLAGRAPEALGVYAHFPWCLQKCPYCDFFSLATPPEAIPHTAYARATIRELERRAPELVGAPKLGSVFFGGGTPSLWDPTELGRLLKAILAAFPNDDTVEVTAECNPSSFDERRAAALLEAGVNRVSLGVQGLDTERLAFLGRLHDGRGALEALRIALAAGFSRVSADLIFGVAGEAPETARDEALRLAELGPTHLSAYALTIEPGTRFGELARGNRLPLLSDDLVARSFDMVREALAGAGFEHYEISNFAREGHHARHNLAVWRGAPYLGLGAGAWGTVTTAEGRIRYRNASSIERYFASVDDAELFRISNLVSNREAITPEIALSERFMLGLRLAEGLDVAHAERETGALAWTAARERAAERLLAAGRLERQGDRLRIPADSWLFADGVVRELI